MLNLNRNQRTTLKVLFRLICRWNLNSISSHNYAKVFLLKVYVTIHNFDIICFSETCLDSSTPFDDNNVEISGYTLVFLDDPSNNQRDGI